jgi:hypothetical protein
MATKISKNSPAFCGATKRARLTFLMALCDEDVFSDALKAMSRIKVGPNLFLEYNTYLSTGM